MRTPMRWIVVSLAGGLLLAGCSASGGDSQADGGFVSTDAAAPESLAEEPAEVAGDVGGDGSETGTSDTDSQPGLNLAASDRQVITSGTVTMTVEDPEAVAAELSQVVEGLGGWVEALDQQAGTEDIEASARMVIRIPSREVTTTLARLRDLGTVEGMSLGRTDVTMQVRDLEARIRALRLSIERMEDLLSRATTTEDLVNAEQMLTDRQSELESLLSQQAQIADQVSMSTLEIQLWAPEALPEPEPEPEPAPEGFWGGLVTGWRAFLEFGENALLVIGVLLPWAAFVALVTAVVVYILRASKRRQAAKGLPAASSPSGPTAALPAMAVPASPTQPGPTPGQVPAGYPGQPPSGYPAGPQGWVAPQPPAPPPAPEPPAAPATATRPKKGSPAA